MTDYRNDPRISRLTRLDLAIGIQHPEHGGYAARTSTSHCCVIQNHDSGTIGRVHAYCGPQGDRDSAEEALLFSLAPRMLDALLGCEQVLHDIDPQTYEAKLTLEKIEAILKELTQ